MVHHTRKQPANDKYDAISGTTGIMGGSDGILLMQKKDRTSLEATIDVTGRDQQDQILHIKKDAKTLIWNLEKLESPIHEEDPDPLLKAVSDLVNNENGIWEGTPTMLAKKIAPEMAVNCFTKYLNINTGRLKDEYQIKYSNRSTHKNRMIKLEFCGKCEANKK